MDLTSLLVPLIVLAIVFYLVFNYLLPLVPRGPFRMAITVTAVLIAILILLSLVGIGPGARLMLAPWLFAQV
jgi:hypothetical protein